MARNTPLTARKLDLAYMIWFGLHLLIMFNVDLVPLYPTRFQPAALLELRKWYIATYNDRFFVQPPAWFTSYAWMELVYHVPLSIWAIPALARDDRLVPIHLLIWGVQTSITTLTCITDYYSWQGVTAIQIKALNGLYGPYLALALFMSFDMTVRLHQTLQQHAHDKMKRQ